MLLSIILLYTYVNDCMAVMDFKYHEQTCARVSFTNVYDNALEDVTSTVACAALCSAKNCTSFVYCEDDSTCALLTEPGTMVPVSIPPENCHVLTENGLLSEDEDTTCPADCGQHEKDVIFIIDESGSISELDFKTEALFIGAVIENFNLSSGAVRIAVLGVGNTPNKRIYLSTYVDDIAGAQADIANFAVPARNQQGLPTLAFEQLRTTILRKGSGDRVGVDNVVVYITDAPCVDPDNAAVEIDSLMQYLPNTEIFAVGVGTRVNPYDFRYIASGPDVDHIFLLRDFTELTTLKDTVVDFVCDPCDPPCLNNNPCNRRRNVCECSGTFTGYRCETVLIAV